MISYSPSFEITPGSLSSTSFADPASASTLFSMGVTKASPLITVLGRYPLTTALLSISESGIIRIVPMSLPCTAFM